jgi:hypothetical protein
MFEVEQFSSGNLNLQTIRMKGNHGTYQIETLPKSQAKAKAVILKWKELRISPTVIEDTLTI